MAAATATAAAPLSPEVAILPTPKSADDARALLADMRQLAPSRSSSIVANVLVFVALLLVFLVFTRAWNAGKAKEANMFGGGPPAAELAAPPPGSGTPPEMKASAISGTVALASGKTAPTGTLFVVVRNAGGPERGPPLAVRRIDAPSFPVSFEVGPDQVMMAGMPFVGPFDVTARLDTDGNAMTRGADDLAAPPVRAVQAGQHGLALVLGADESSAAPAGSTEGAHASPHPSPALGAPPEASPPALPTTGAAGVLRGEVKVADGLGDAGRGTLFVVVRAAGSPDRGPPVAVRKYDNPRFPLSYEIGSGDVMLEGATFQGPFDVWARLDRDGDAASRQPGDLEASAPAPHAMAGGAAADVTLDRRR